MPASVRAERSAAHGDATRVEITTQFVLRGASRIAGPIFARWYGRAWAQGLETLKRLMESEEL